jgi:2-aminoadipate transaminase
MSASLRNVRKTYAERARIMGESLKRELGDTIEFAQPHGGLFFWARLTRRGRESEDAGELAKWAIEQGVALVPGAPFFVKDPDVSTPRPSLRRLNGGDWGRGREIETAV